MLPKTGRQILVCGRLPRNKNFAIDHPKFVFVEPSLLWFVNDKIPINPSVIEKDNRGVYRMFASGHASVSETHALVSVIKSCIQ